MESITDPTPKDTTFRVAICAGAGFSDWDYFVYAADILLQNRAAGPLPIEIIYGACTPFEDTFQIRPNIDQLAHRYAKEKGYIATPVKTFFELQGDAALPLRYTAMREYAHAVLAFWDRKDKSIRKMINLSEKEGLAVRVAPWYYHQPKKLLTA